MKTFEVCDLPVRAAKFVARKNWVVTGAVSCHLLVISICSTRFSNSFSCHSFVYQLQI